MKKYFKMIIHLPFTEEEIAVEFCKYLCKNDLFWKNRGLYLERNEDGGYDITRFLYTRFKWEQKLFPAHGRLMKENIDMFIEKFNKQREERS